MQSDEKCFDIHKIKKRIPDDVAFEIIKEITNCQSATEFQNLSIVIRNQNITLLHKKGISIRQLNRLTGIPIGTISKILKKKVG